MDKCSQISLSRADLQKRAYLAGRLGKDFRRFGPLIEGECVPVHLPRSAGGTVTITPANATHGDPPWRISVPAMIEAMAKHNAYKFGQHRQVLTVRTADAMGQDSLALTVECALESEIDAFRKFDREGLAHSHAHELEARVHLIADDGKNPHLLFTREGGKIVPLLSAAMDAEWIVGMKRATRLWMMDALARTNELPSGTGKVEYLGAMVDVETGAFGLAGALTLNTDPPGASSAMKKAEFAPSPLEATTLRAKEFRKWVDEKRDEMAPQMITSCALLGYRLFGADFLG